MPEVKCADCSLRAKYDKNPKSLLGRFWRWHIGFCPGWRGYMDALSDSEKDKLKKQYNLK